MDAIGLSIGIIGLYSFCRDCLVFFSDVRSAEQSAVREIRAFGIQQSILKAWGFYWEIDRDGAATKQAEGQQPVVYNKKIGQYLVRNPYKIDGVKGALCAIADALSDFEGLLNKYGIELKGIQGYKPVGISCVIRPTLDLTLASRATSWTSRNICRVLLIPKTKSMRYRKS